MNILKYVVIENKIKYGSLHSSYLQLFGVSIVIVKLRPDFYAIVLIKILEEICQKQLFFFSFFFLFFFFFFLPYRRAKIAP